MEGTRYFHCCYCYPFNRRKQYPPERIPQGNAKTTLYLTTGTQIVWNITVTNVDTDNVTLNQYSTFTLIPNKEGAQDPWYLEKVVHSDESTSPTITPDETVTLIYRWTTSEQKHNESTPGSEGQYRIFLTFYGTFSEQNGAPIPYGQTIPFEAVLVTK